MKKNFLTFYKIKRGIYNLLKFTLCSIKKIFHIENFFKIALAISALIFACSLAFSKYIEVKKYNLDVKKHNLDVVAQIRLCKTANIFRVDRKDCYLMAERQLKGETLNRALYEIQKRKTLEEIFR